jgi:ubiquinone/menaquinone biosynthesis C-methylase UbiE
VVDDIPVMLVDEAEVTHHYIERTLEQVSGNADAGDAAESPRDGDAIDEYVQNEVPYTSGILYFAVQHRLTRYPIPELRLPEGEGQHLLDVGCNWGRWSIAAAQKGYKPVGIDPSLDAVRAARRVSRQLGVETAFVAGDARFLPFREDAFDTVISYSVLQHFSKENARVSLAEIGRVLKPDGRSLVQMPNKFGIRSFYQRWRRGFTEGEGFDVRYWAPAELVRTFEELFGPTEMTADCYFGLGIQGADVDIMPLPYKMVVYSSETLRSISRAFSPLIKLADSLYLESVNQKKAAHSHE